MRRLGVFLLVLPLVLVIGLGGAMAGGRGSNATYFNNASLPAADPYVLRDGGYYYAYSTEGADPGYHFAIYRSADLATWQRIPGGALPAADPGQWGRDWFWAPEVYHNPATGKYFLFYAARLAEPLVAEYFKYPDFEEPSKIGVAVADSPTGPFHNITDRPIDYRPYDPDYHDVNLIMRDPKRPPASLEEGLRAPLGTYLPSIDPNVFFDGDRIYLYFSRNAYRNWVWDPVLGKYIEESNIYAVELTDDWWRDPSGTTMPSIAPRYRDANRSPQDPPGARRDGFSRILDYGSDPQAWENAHVNDYQHSGGRKKDRRWEEGSTTVKRYDSAGRPVYFLTYSANNYENRFYGVGYAVARSPLGPWRKSPANPVLQQDERIGMYSTGHGSVVASPDGSEWYYVHHGRPTPDTMRRLYTERMGFDADTGKLRIDQSTSDEPIPSGVAPYSLVADRPWVDVSDGEGRISWSVRTARDAAVDLANPLNRVAVSVDPPGAVEVRAGADEAQLRGRVRVAALTLRYQREKATGGYADVDNLGPRRPVALTVPVVGCRQTRTGRIDGPVEVSEGVLCLRDATVRGSVRVLPGAALVSVDSVVTGRVQAHGAQAVWLSGGRVGGPVDVTGTSGLVRLDGVSVGDSASLRDNRTRARIVVAGNRISGSLRCTGNVPAPEDESRPNTVDGDVSGQCSGM
ncbi:hypothetical protein GCM10025787_58770 [Saccharopolyspora rosea]